MRFWCARLAGTAANQMLMVAIGWQMYDLTGSAWDLGLVGLLQFAARAAAGAGGRPRASTATTARASSRLHGAAGRRGGGARAGARRRAGPAASCCSALSVLIGTAKAFQMPAQQAITPLLVPAEVLPRALAFSSAGMQGAIIAGPALGGFVYVAGATAVYASCAALFALAGVLVLGVRYHHAPRGRAGGRRWTRCWPACASSGSAQVVLGAISLDLFAVLLGGATALLPMFAKDVLHVGPWGLGLLRAAPAVGALAHRRCCCRAGRSSAAPAACCSARWPSTAWRRWCFGAVDARSLLSMAALAVSGAADMVSVVIRQSLVQLETPDEMRGRVSAVNSVFIGASNQLGEFESGATAALLGPVGSVVLGGVGSMLIAALWVDARSRRWRGATGWCEPRP